MKTNVKRFGVRMWSGCSWLGLGSVMAVVKFVVKFQVAEKMKNFFTIGVIMGFLKDFDPWS